MKPDQHFPTITFSILSLLIHLGCSTSQSAPNLLSSQLMVIDSFDVATNSILIPVEYDSDNDRLLFFDIKNRSILVTDQSGKELYNWNKSGSGPDAHPADVRGLGFLGEDQIAILSPYSYHIYDIEGNLKQSAKFETFIPSNPDRGFRLRTYYATNGDAHLLINGSPVDPGLLTGDQWVQFQTDLNWISDFNLQDQTIITGAPYQTDLYRKNVLTGRKSPEIAFDRTSNNVLVLFPQEPIIYEFSLPDLQLSKSTKLSPDHFFEPVGIPREQATDNVIFGKLTTLDWENCNYLNIAKFGDTILTHYQTRVPPGTDIKGSSMEVLTEMRKHYVEAYKHGEKLGEWIVPDGIWYYFQIDSKKMLGAKMVSSTLSTEPAFSRYVILSLP